METMILLDKKKSSIDQKRKLNIIDSRDKIFIIRKDISHKASLEIPFQKIYKEKNDNINQNNEND